MGVSGRVPFIGQTNIGKSLVTNKESLNHKTVSKLFVL